jgi:hypothetical protein
MCDWMAAAAGLLKPLWQSLKEHILRSKVLHTDDTTAPVRDESRTSHRHGRLWDYIGDAEHPGVVFDYTVNHARDGPAEFLKGFRGYLQADAYGAYDGIYTGSSGTMIEVGGGGQTTADIYGVTTATGSTIDSNDIVGTVEYPNPTTGLPSSSFVETTAVNGLGQTLTYTDRNGTVLA